MWSRLNSGWWRGKGKEVVGVDGSSLEASGDVLVLDRHCCQLVEDSDGWLGTGRWIDCRAMVADNQSPHVLF